jgi:hypothetical protein
LKHTITFVASGNHYVIDEATSLAAIERGEPLFFKTTHGKRETYETYRGFLIVRNTVQFTGCKPERRTVVYLYTDDLEGRPGTLCVSAGSKVGSTAQARRLIDRIIETGKYSYGMQP